MGYDRAGEMPSSCKWTEYALVPWRGRDSGRRVGMVSIFFVDLLYCDVVEEEGWSEAR